MARRGPADLSDLDELERRLTRNVGEMLRRALEDHRMDDQREPKAGSVTKAKFSGKPVDGGENGVIAGGSVTKGELSFDPATAADISDKIGNHDSKMHPGDKTERGSVSWGIDNHYQNQHARNARSAAASERSMVGEPGAARPYDASPLVHWSRADRESVVNIQALLDAHAAADSTYGAAERNLLNDLHEAVGYLLKLAVDAVGMPGAAREEELFFDTPWGLSFKELVGVDEHAVYGARQDAGCVVSRAQSRGASVGAVP